MIKRLIQFFKKKKNNYIRNWKEQDNFEKYASIAFVLIVVSAVAFTTDSQQEHVSAYLNVLAIFFMAIVIKRTKKAKKEVVEKNKEIELQKRIIEEHQKEMIDSITYAKRIQDAIIPTRELIKNKLPNTFVLYKPKDIVAGDFYWMEQINESILIAVADCTGHGVPGAMVSVVCSNALNRAVKEFHFTDTGQILDKATDLVIETFEKSSSEIQDGMDISLISINKTSQQIQWSGANNPLWYFDNNELKEITADKQPIGKSSHRKPFRTHLIKYKPNTIFYLFTDGYADQFGGPKGKKYKYKQLQETLAETRTTNPADQETALKLAFEKWKGDLEQVDDVCIIGIKI